MTESSDLDESHDKSFWQWLGVQTHGPPWPSDPWTTPAWPVSRLVSDRKLLNQIQAIVCPYVGSEWRYRSTKQLH